MQVSQMKRAVSQAQWKQRIKARYETTAIRFPPKPQRTATPPRVGVAAAGAVSQTQRVSGAEYPCGRTDG